MHGPIRMNLVAFSYVIFSVGVLNLAATAQQPLSKNRSSQSAENTPNRLQPLGSTNRSELKGNAGAGGADFTQLIELIETTVDSNWEVDGGEDSISEYRNGVWIDPNGRLHRLDSKQIRSSIRSSLQKLNQAEGENNFVQTTVATHDSKSLEFLGRLQHPEAVRWVSLADLSVHLQESSSIDETIDSSRSFSSIALLGGLSKIEYLARSQSTGAWLVGGPAGGFVLDGRGNLVSMETRLPPVLVEDLLTVAYPIANRSRAIGCSIDPVRDRLLAAQNLIATTNPQSIARRTDVFATKLAETLGDQNAVAIGVPKDSPTANALLIADEHMKRIALGLEPGPAELFSYWEECERKGEVPVSSMVRWWFTMPDQIQIESIGTIEVAESEDRLELFRLASPTVRVLSQRQWMDDRGNRHDDLQEPIDPAAESFAVGFSEHFEKIQHMYPAHGRLRHIFDLSVAVQWIMDVEGETWKSNRPVWTQQEYQPRNATPIESIPTVSSWRKLTSGRVAVIASGGVSIDPSRKLQSAPAAGQLDLSPHQYPAVDRTAPIQAKIER